MKGTGSIGRRNVKVGPADAWKLHFDEDKCLTGLKDVSDSLVGRNGEEVTFRSSSRGHGKTVDRLVHRIAADLRKLFAVHQIGGAIRGATIHRRGLQVRRERRDPCIRERTRVSKARIGTVDRALHPMTLGDGQRASLIPWDTPSVIFRVKHERQHQLALIVHALDSPGPRTCCRQRGEQQGSQNRDDGNDHQQLNQGKAAGSASSSHGCCKQSSCSASVGGLHCQFPAGGLFGNVGPCRRPGEF